MSDDFSFDSIDNLSLILGDADEVVEIDVNDIIPDPEQPRKDRNAEADKELAQSIFEKGILQAIVVRPKDDLGRYKIAFGHRRWDGAIIAKLSTVPCVIKDIDPSEILCIQTIENVQREDMSLADEVRAVAKIVDQYSVKETARMLGKKTQYVSKKVRVNKSKKYIHDFIKMGFSSDMEAFYELALLDSKYPVEAKQLVDSWIISPALRSSLRKQIEDIKKRLSVPKEKDKHIVNLPTTKEKLEPDVDSIKEIESIISEKGADKNKKNSSKILKENNIVNSLNITGDPGSFEIKAMNNETLLSFLFDDGEKIEINIAENLWSQFVDEINKR